MKPVPRSPNAKAKFMADVAMRGVDYMDIMEEYGMKNTRENRAKIDLWYSDLEIMNLRYQIQSRLEQEQRQDDASTNKG